MFKNNNAPLTAGNEISMFNNLIQCSKIRRSQYSTFSYPNSASKFCSLNEKRKKDAIQ